MTRLYGYCYNNHPSLMCWKQNVSSVINIDDAKTIFLVLTLYESKFKSDTDITKYWVYIYSSISSRNSNTHASEFRENLDEMFVLVIVSTSWTNTSTNVFTNFPVCKGLNLWRCQFVNISTKSNEKICLQDFRVFTRKS